MTTSLVQLHCGSLRSKSAYAAFGDFHEEHADLMGATTTYWCLKTMSKAGPVIARACELRCCRHSCTQSRCG